MRRLLWPECDDAEHEAELRTYLPGTAAAAMFVCEREPGGLCGFVAVGLRSQAAGQCGHEPVGYLEGWYVDPECRRRGIGKALVRAAEAWCREAGCTQLASSAEIDDGAAQLAHAAIGFEEVERTVQFLRPLAGSIEARRPAKGSLTAEIPAELPDELSNVLVREGDLRVERIVSRGHVSPPGYWYEQDEDELVLVVAGAARLDVEGEGEVELAAGDWIDLPRRVRHRVTWTDPDRDTIWLAMFRGRRF